MEQPGEKEGSIRGGTQQDEEGGSRRKITEQSKGRDDEPRGRAGDKDEDRGKEDLKKSKKKEQELWKAYDFLFPGGKLAKLVKVHNIYRKSQPYGEMLAKLRFTDALPVLNLIGAATHSRGKFYAGVARACFNTDAVIVDNGLASGIEKFCLRRGVKLFGVAPENEVKYPKINPTSVDPMELANGHSHLALVNNPDGTLSWGGENHFKAGLCKALAEGRRPDQPSCKVVAMLVGDPPFDCLDEIRLAVQNDQPVIVVPGSKLGDNLIANQSLAREEQSWLVEEMAELTKKGHFFYCNSLNS